MRATRLSTFVKPTSRVQTFWKANLKGTDLLKADLQGANLSSSKTAGRAPLASESSGRRACGSEPPGCRPSVSKSGGCESDWDAFLAQLSPMVILRHSRGHLLWKPDSQELCPGPGLHRDPFVRPADGARSSSGFGRISSDCGRSFLRWGLWSVGIAALFGLIYFLMGPGHIKVDPPLPFSWVTMIYYSVVTFTTLGFGDIKRATETAAMVVMLEVILGYIMLGGLIAILANKVARRS